ncbi:MAG: PhzF family phenazine biosynthesis isomerase [Proteobacteria bacterium]|nr:PhzF family phenazine biosynthesis isomerase [Pseudomonadota bacterium]
MAKRTVNVFQIDVFTDQLFAGNPAGVVLGAEHLSEVEMQALARELNNSDSAFVLPPDAPDHDVRLRFFTPNREVGFVGHASVAAHVARLAAGQGKTGRLRQKGRAGIYDVEVSGTAAAPRVSVAIPAPDFQPPIDLDTRARLLDIFGIDTAALDPKCPVVVTKRTSTRLMIGLRSADLLASLQPNLEELKRMTPHVGADGYFLFVRDARGPGTTEARLFSPVLGIPEDPVSGNAHGMLGAYLVANGLLPVTGGRARLRGYQGKSMDRPGEIDVEVEVADGRARRIHISGTARVVFTTEVTLD